MKLSDATALYVGSDEVAKVYLGEDEVWSKGGDGDYIVFSGEITVGYNSPAPGYELYGWSKGTAAPQFGSFSGPASALIDTFFYWADGIGAVAATTVDISGSILTFQGETIICAYDDDLDAYAFSFDGDISGWPTSGTHSLTLKIPREYIKEGNITVGDYNDQGNILGWSVSHGIGALTGDAAEYFYNSFIWGLMGSNYGGYATLSSELDGSRLLFQDNLYQHAYNPSLGLYGYQFGEEVTAWPTSGTHKFWVLLPSSE